MGHPDLSLFGADLIERFQAFITQLEQLPEKEQIEVLNQMRQSLHSVSPFRDEPVDLVVWVLADEVEANDYNPNTVAPPEMRLLEHSISKDGYTQPVVTWCGSERREVVDGFHRNHLGRTSSKVKKRTQGYIPVTTVNQERTGRNDRIAATIRHNRARGKHQVAGMSDIVQELAKRNWSDKRIGKELGMEPDEVLRLKQVTGLAELFADEEFSEAWEAAEE